MKTLGLIGFGQFGQLAARHLKSRFDLVVYDPAADPVGDIAGITVGDLRAAADCDVVVLAVPVKAMPKVLAAIAPLLKPGALVVDVASVKVLPARWMEETLPAHVDVVATHPLFGPQSAKDGLTDLAIAVCPVRGERSENVVAFCRELGLRVIVTTADEHDREMAYVQALTHLIGRTLARMNIPDEMLKTASYQHLLELCGLLKFDTMELFAAIQNDNPYAPEVSLQFVREAAALLEEAKAKASDRAG